MPDFHSFYNLDSKLALENLRTTPSGLSLEEVAKRQEKYGKNIFPEGRRHTLLQTFVGQFFNPLIFILIFASLITIYLGEIIETVVIWAAILINVFFSTYQEYKAENTIEQLRKIIKNKALVRRGGEEMEIDAEELTVGDIVILQYGRRVPADIRILEFVDLKIDESILTGESIPVPKHNLVITESLVSERKNYAFCGTLVVNGGGVGVVTHIAEHTEVGKIAESLRQTKKVLTPVQTAVEKISWYIFMIALCIVVLIFVLGVYRGENLFEMLILAAAVAVGAVPEALPIALTIILSIGVLNISRKGGLIRKLAAAETLGSTTLILTDKTGTLTEGKLTLENIITQRDLLLADVVGGVSENFNLQKLDEEQKRILSLAACNFSVIIKKTGRDRKKWEYTGNAFEVILTRIIEENNLRTQQNCRLLLPFNSSNKYSVSEANGENIILGAPDILIENSNLHYEDKLQLLKRIHLLSDEGKRLVAVASKKISADNTNTHKFVLEDITVLGLFVFSDTLRKGIRSAVLEIVGKGVKVKMLTGDLPGTAKFIAKGVGLEAESDEILTGAQLENFSDSELKELLPRIKIFARVTPEDKLRIGKLYQELGEIVAMTGDGVNDATSLKAMDIGISLSSATEVAKSAADMILLRDNFKTIVSTIKEGHTIKKNIQKVFVYLMSNSLDEIFVITGALLAGLSLPLTALQIIWVNILTGTLPALAFAYDKNSDDVGSKNTSTQEKQIFTFKVRVLAIGIGALSSFLLFLLYYLLSVYITDTRLAQSIFFLCFAIYVLFIAYSFIDLDKFIWQYNPFKNWRLNAGVLLGLVFIFLSVYTSFGQNIFELVAIPLIYLWIVVAWVFVNIWVIEFTKFLFKLKSY